MLLMYKTFVFSVLLAMFYASAQNMKSKSNKALLHKINFTFRNLIRLHSSPTRKH